MANAYIELKRRQEKEFNDFPIFFAFSKDQFKEGMKNFGLNETETDKILSIGGGGFIREADETALDDLIQRHTKELKDAIDADETGNGFVFDMFNYELANHEYIITYDVSDTLDALGLTAEEVNASEKLKNALYKARLAQSENE